MASHLVTVARLLPGQMVSMPECDVPLSYDTAISKPFMGMRAIDLVDPDTGNCALRRWVSVSTVFSGCTTTPLSTIDIPMSRRLL